MSLPSSSSTTTSSPSLKYNLSRSPERESDEAAAASRFNPLFIHTSANATNNHMHKFNHAHSSNTTSTSGLNHTSNHSTNSIAVEHSSINHSKVGSPVTAASRKVQVVYYLSRSGQLEHPHLLEVSIPPNQGLYLKDVKKRLAVIRGKRLPLTFAWSYKRSYKNGYVWQDLCDEDLIFPAHGCEYVLKGSEILNDQRTCKVDEEGETTTNAELRQSVQNNVGKEHQGLTTRDPKVAHQNLYNESKGVADTAFSNVSMVESGTDAATQTEEDLRLIVDDGQDNQDDPVASYSSYGKHQDVILTRHPANFSPHGGKCATTRPQNAIELNNAELASPPSSSSATNSPSPFKEIASTSSSCTSGFTVATDCRSVRVGSRDHVKPMSDPIHPGSKTPGRPWMKKEIQKLEEQDEMMRLRTAENADENGANGHFDTRENAPGSKVKYGSTIVGNNTVAAVILEEAEQSPASCTKPTRGKHSSALSLLQFMSCGGLDIKEQILPMSLYRLRSKGTPATANHLHMSYVFSPEHSIPESFSTYGGSESSKSWTKLGKPKSLCINSSASSSKPVFKSSGEFTNGQSDGRNQHGSCHYSHSLQAKSPSDVGNGRAAKPLGASMPDVISIGRSSISDRSTNVSHELEYYAADIHSRPKKSGEEVNNANTVMQGSPRSSRQAEALQNLRNGQILRPTAMGALPARAVSGEILMSKGSPLFVPGRRHLSYSSTPLNYVGGSIKPLGQLVSTASALETHHEAGNNGSLAKQADGNGKSLCSNSSCNPSRAFSDGEISCMLTMRNALGMSGEQIRSATINGYDQSMAQLWEELLAAPALMSSEEHQQKDADLQRVRQVATGSNSAREVERTLQNAVELSLQPPLEHLLLHVDCPQCGRKVKADAMKAHVKSCGKPPPKPSSNSASDHPHQPLCQRFLRASPPPKSC